MLDLYNIKYDRQILKENIYALKLIDILKTQHLDISFVVKYIMSDLYQFEEEDKNIDIELVIKYQPHISKETLIQELNNYNSDDDSVENFEIFSNKN